MALASIRRSGKGIWDGNRLERVRPSGKAMGNKAAMPRHSVFITLSLHDRAAVAQLAARRSHNPKVVSSILTRSIFTKRVTRTMYCK